MLNKVFLLQMAEHGYEGFTIIGDNLNQSTPSAEYVLKDLIAEGLCGLFLEHSELRIMSEWASALDNIEETARSG